MKNLTVLSAIVLSGIFVACNNTPQEKAEDQVEKYEEKAYDAAQDASNSAIDASDKSLESVIYANMAAANEAVAKIPMPELSNATAKDLCSKLGKSIVNRINAADSSKVADTEKNILQEKNNVEKALIDKKITDQDKSNIFNYADDCLAAAKSIT